MKTLSKELREAAIEWIMECSWNDIHDESDVVALSDDQLIKGLNKNYAGGLEQFIQDC